ncbi:MAG: alcohol dehydrogenase [Sphingomonadales bacterium]
MGVVAAGQPLEEIELPDITPTGTEVLVEVTHCGVCHTDVHFWEGELDTGGPQKVPIAAMGLQLPLVLGHEIIGRVAAMGPDAQGVAVGDLRIVYPWIGCGHCPACDAGRDDLCEAQAAIGVRARGGFGSHVLVPHPRYLVDPGDLDPAAAATLACSGLTTYSAISKLLPLQPDEPVVIIGAGGLGLTAVSILRALDHRSIVVVDIDDSRLAAARDAGASATVNSSDQTDLVPRIREAAGGPVRNAIDFVNGAQTAPTAFALPARGGKVVMVGMFGGALHLPLMAVATRSLTLQGSFVGSLDNLRRLVELARSGKLKPIPLTIMPKARATEALAALRDGTMVGRAVLSA